MAMQGKTEQSFGDAMCQPLVDILFSTLPDKLMTKDEIVKRRFEAMRMKWPDKTMTFYTQECLIRWPGHWVCLNV